MSASTSATYGTVLQGTQAQRRHPQARPRRRTRQGAVGPDRNPRVTWRACRARFTAAWPAELAPPAMKTRCPAMAPASEPAAP